MSRAFPPPPAWASALPTVGVTGTNGKTTTTAWVAAALRAGTAAPVVRATTVGVFLDDELLDVPPTYDGFLAAMCACRDRGGRAAAIELTSEALALGFATAWPVRVGVFTNLTHDHLDAHGTPEHYLASKAQLFVHLPAGGTAVLNARDPASALLAEVLPPGVRTFSYATPDRAAPLAREAGTAKGEAHAHERALHPARDLEGGSARDAEGGRGHGAHESRDAEGGRGHSAHGSGDEGGGVVREMEGAHRTDALDLLATRVEPTWSGTEITVCSANGWRVPALLRVRAIGEVYAENALAALGAALAFGVPAEVAAAAIEAAAPPPGRFEVVAERPYLVVDYAHSPDALERAVRTAKRLCEGKGRVTLVFGAGGDRDRKKRAPMGHAARAADRVIVTTDNPRREDPSEIARAIRDGLGAHAAAETILDRAAAIEAAVRDAAPEDVVLVAGRGHETEQLLADGPRPFSDALALRAAASRRVA